MDVGLCLELQRDTLCLEQKNIYGFLGWLKINGISRLIGHYFYEKESMYVTGLC